MAGNRSLKDIVTSRTDCFRSRPEAALYTPKVTSRHVRNLCTETRVREHLITSDYGEAAGGGNQAPNPIEMLLAAFAACIEAAFYEFAEHAGLAIESVEADVEGTLDLRGLFMIDDVPAGFREIRYVLRIASADDGARVRSLAEKVLEHCPVVESLKKPTAVSGRIEIRPPASGP